jgi:ferredoxin-NADP reductase
VTDLLYDVPHRGDTHYYLCGLDTMIDEVTAWLETKGVPITRIHRECFFNAAFES